MVIINAVTTLQKFEDDVTTANTFLTTYCHDASDFKQCKDDLSKGSNEKLLTLQDIITSTVLHMYRQRMDFIRMAVGFKESLTFRNTFTEKLSNCIFLVFILFLKIHKFKM